MNEPEPKNTAVPGGLSRREAIQWVLAAAASAPWLGSPALAAAAAPYGRDPKVNAVYKPGDLWPLTFSAAERKTAAALCDLIIPAEEGSPSAGAVAVPEFIDEWISAPYESQQSDRKTVIDGLAWIEAESGRRFGKGFAELEPGQQSALADDICYAPDAKPEFKSAAAFFEVFRNLTAGGYYTTRDGMHDIGFRGNVPMSRYSGPPKEILEKLGLAP